MTDEATTENSTYSLSLSRSHLHITPITMAMALIEHKTKTIGWLSNTQCTHIHLYFAFMQATLTHMTSNGNWLHRFQCVCVCVVYITFTAIFLLFPCFSWSTCYVEFSFAIFAYYLFRSTLHTVYLHRLNSTQMI